MKRTVSAIVCAVVLFSGLALLHASVSRDRNRSFSGEIINITDTFLELKRGRREITLYFDQSTKYFDRSGAEGAKSVIELCQVVRATYTTRENRNILVRLQVVRPGKCYQAKSDK